jgi:ATP-dependent helicase/nuclease subunit B
MAKLNLVYGEAKTGKSEFLLNEVKSKINLGKDKIFIIVPEQFSFSMEKKLLNYLKKDSLIGIEVLSFNRVYDRVAHEVSGLIDVGLNESR